MCTFEVKLNFLVTMLKALIRTGCLLIYSFSFVILLVVDLQAQMPVGEIVEFTSDGAWCWFQDPRSVYIKGEHERVYAQ